jgi:hypothetical protein
VVRIGAGAVPATDTNAGRPAGVNSFGEIACYEAAGVGGLSACGHPRRGRSGLELYVALAGNLIGRSCRSGQANAHRRMSNNLDWNFDFLGLGVIDL